MRQGRTGLPIYSTSWLRTLQDWSSRLSSIISFVQAHNHYTEGEELTGETWINGQPIFRKVLNISPLPDTTQTDHTLGFQYDRIIKMGGYAYASTLGVTLPIPSATAGPTAEQTVQIYVNKTVLSVYTEADYSDYTEAYVTLEYIKE